MMLRQIARFSIILILSVAVSGLIYTVFNNANVLPSGDFDGGNRPQMRSQNQAGARLDGGQHQMGERGEGGGMGATAILLNLGKVSLVTLVIVLVNLGVNRIKVKRQHFTSVR